MRAPTVPRLTTNVIQNIKEAKESIPILFQPIPLVVFHPDAPTFSPSVLIIVFKWITLPACANTAQASQALTETTTPNTATLETVGSSKINSNRARPTGGQIVSPSPPAKLDSDVMLAASF